MWFTVQVFSFFYILTSVFFTFDLDIITSQFNEDFSQPQLYEGFNRGIYWRTMKFGKTNQSYNKFTSITVKIIGRKWQLFTFSRITYNERVWWSLSIRYIRVRLKLSNFVLGVVHELHGVHIYCVYYFLTTVYKALILRTVTSWRELG